MSSAKHYAILLLASTASSAAFAQSSVSLVLGDEQQVVQTPAQASNSGISYAQTGAATSTLNVYTKGFLFCANVSPNNTSASPVTFSLAHEDQTFTPAHPWTFSYGTDVLSDVLSVSYNANGLRINRAADTSLFCRGTDQLGQMSTGLSEGIFDEGFDSVTERNYNHLVNWLPTRGFTWDAPDWNAVPQDGCDTLAGAHVDEDVACAAVTGVNASTLVRAATMRTQTDFVKFTYLFRLDGRAGPQTPDRSAVFALPEVVDNVADVDPSHPIIRIIDAFEGGDTGGVGFLGTEFKYCFLTEQQVPSTLNSSVCNGHSPVPGTGRLNVAITMGGPPGAGITQSYYVAVIRSVVAGHPNPATPVVAAAVILDPAVVGVGGDRFRGDDVVFGFLPGAPGFPWMTNQ